MELQVALLFVWFALIAAHGSDQDLDMQTNNEYTVTMDPKEKFNVSWSFDGTAPSNYITFTITCRTTGWVGIGLSPNGAMTDADIMVGWVDADGSSHLLDMYATSNGVPVEDMSQDVTLIYADETDGVTTVKFKRKIDTCDVDGDNMITSSTTRLIYAYKDSDPENGKIESSDYHVVTNRGVRSVYLLQSNGVNKPESFPTDTLSFDIRIRDYNMPAEDTIYYCSFHDPPVHDTKHHVVAIVPLITEGNLGLVHHILLYGCWGIEDEHLRDNNKTEGQCFTAEMPEFVNSCAMIQHGWAVGGETFYYPEEAGYAIGGTDGTAPQYYMMQMHYDNPELLDTFVDSSGLRLIYSPSLREEDAGTVSVGMVDGIAVPPQTSNFRTVSFCDSRCTNEWIPEEGIQMFGYLLHTHLIGSSAQVEWYRKGEYLGLLAHDDSYDFNFQHVRHFNEKIKVLPGDTLKLTCNYTNPADRVVYGGLPTSDEMCLAFFLYYPRQNIFSCSSVPDMLYNPDDPVYKSLSLNATRYNKQYGVITADMHVLDEVSDWTAEAVTIVQDAYDLSSHYSTCYKNNYELCEEGHYQPINTTAYQSERRPMKELCVVEEEHDEEDDDYDHDKEKENEKSKNENASSQLRLMHSTAVVMSAVIITLIM